MQQARRLGGVAAVVAVLLVGEAVQAQPGKGRGESGAVYGWLSDYQAARAAARKDGKPMMLVFRCVP
jgi:hypothetical protein